MRCSSRKPTSNQARQQVAQLGLRALQRRVALGAVISSARRSTRNFTPSGNALKCVRSLMRGALQSFAQDLLGLQALHRLRCRLDGGHRGIDFARIGTEFLGQYLRKRPRPSRIESEIGTPQHGGVGARRDLAAVGIEAIAHLGAQGIGIVRAAGRAPGRGRCRTVRPRRATRRAADRAARRRRSRRDGLPVASSIVHGSDMWPWASAAKTVGSGSIRSSAISPGAIGPRRLAVQPGRRTAAAQRHPCPGPAARR